MTLYPAMTVFQGQGVGNAIWYIVLSCESRQEGRLSLDVGLPVQFCRT